MKNKPSTHRQQQGVVLVTAIMFLVVLTLLVISMMRTSIVEERMVAYSRDWNLAFQAAESALRDAEREITTGTRIAGQTGFVYGCSAASDSNRAGLCLPNLCTNTTAGSGFDCYPVWIDLEKQQSDASWVSGSDTGKSVKYGAETSAVALTGVAAQPRYIIEVLSVPNASSLKPPPGQPAQKFVYRATAVGFGANINTRVMLQGTYRQY